MTEVMAPPSPPNTAGTSEQGDVQDTKMEQNKENHKTTQSSSKPQKPRHRASVACASCRDRRIRCVVPSGEKMCTQCKRSGVECVIKNDDERRRPISRAYMCSLTERVALLEGMLKEHGADLPPANHPPKTRHGATNDEQSPNRKGAENQSQNQENSSPGSQPSPADDFVDIDHHDQMEHETHHHHSEADSAGSPSMLPPPKRDGMVSRLLSTRGHLSFDQLSGRLRYFGPTTNCHVHSELGNTTDLSTIPSEQARRAEKIIRSLPMETYDYLMDLFWQCYNPVIHVLHQEAFNEDREAGRTQFYSGFLHVCILAMGFRFADKSRADIQRIALPTQESTLHREAKYMLDSELERPGGIPSVVALLLLGDLECGVGRDNLGWLYAGLAVRLAFDIGLHLDTRLSGLPEREVEIRQMTLWACVVYDKYWALFLGRPTSMKSADLEIYSLSKQFERLGTCRPAGPEKSMETQIYEALLDLMELAGKITENMDPRCQTPDSIIDRNQYLRMAALDREFSTWYARLPEQLKWTPANITTAPFSFFLLHQQYHSSLILLHRPFAMYEDQTQQGYEDSGPDNHFSALSRTVCTKHAIRVARIFWQHRQRFDTKQIFVTGLQHAGTAATALVAALAFIKDPLSRNNNMQYLECLSAALSDMSLTYQPAERMSTVLRAVMVELRSDIPVDAHRSMNAFKLYKPSSALVPARRGSTNEGPGTMSLGMGMHGEDGEGPLFKKRQMSGVGREGRPRMNTRGKTRTMSMSTTLTSTTTATAASTEILGGSKNPPPTPLSMHRYDAESDRGDGYIMVTPRSEISGWGMDAHGHTNGHSTTTPSMHSHSHSATLSTPSTLSTSAPRNAWMGAELDPSDSISQLANIHFPEMSSLGGPTGSNLAAGLSESLNGDGHGDEEAMNMSHLDFMSLGEVGGGEWGREWGAGGEAVGGVGSDLDGFPPQGGLGGFGFERGFGGEMV